MLLKRIWPRAKSIGISAALLYAATAMGASPSVPVVLKKTGTLAAGKIAIPGLKASAAYSLLFSVDSPRAFGPATQVLLDLRQGPAELVHKTLHMGDPDLYAMFHVPRNGPAELRIQVVSTFEGRPGYRLQVNRWPDSPALEKEPNNRWQDANQIALGGTVFASGDEEAYIPAPGTRNPAPQEDWYKLDFRERSPKLVFFQIDLMERDNLPVDVSIYRVVDGKVVPYNEGEDPVSLPHEVQALPGNKFAPRVLKEPGAYYIRVVANHPEYKLRTRVYDAPPYNDPRQAVQTAVDYIMGAGDSWHANTPRRGGILDRVANVHQETSLCVACHPTHFSQRAQLMAVKNGYAIHEKQQLQFLSERFYNNPRPFYGFEKQGAVWARMISAAANVLTRMSALLDMFETAVSGEPRPWYHEGVKRYLDLYYRDRDGLPPDETNGNAPLVSTYEVAWYSWRVSRDERIARLIEQDHIRNMVDLCYQTLALADIDRVKHADHIRRNAERILSLQRPDGQWAMRFEANQPEAEFQTGHALWALHEAGIPRDNPQVTKAIDYLMKRQQPFGGWMDPLQSYENFRTPFRETQFAVVALSSYFPCDGRRRGWGSTALSLSSNPVKELEDLDSVWDAPAPAVRDEILAATRSDDVLMRQAAVEAVGRLAPEAALSVLKERLGDESKLVQRTAAWAMRQVYSRHADTPPETLAESLAATSDRTRWGATRVFATHFAALARRPDVARPLAALAADPVPSVRMQALKGLWQFWFWSADDSAKGLIEDTFLEAMAKPQHPWVRRNLREGIYNLADENIRYLYNNWVPLLARPEDRERAIRGRLAVEDRLATKFDAVLENGSDLQRKELLAGLTEFHLRRADVYDPKAVPGAPFPPVYNRIGNDTEQIVFFGPSNARFARALGPLLRSSDPETRRLAGLATLLCRSVKFPGVNEVAGSPSTDRDVLITTLENTPDSADVLKAYRGVSPRSVTAARRTVEAPKRYKRPDESWFRAYVQPILEKRGKDGYACVHCHATHTLFNGTYETALHVVDLNDPENSLILRKPTSSSDSEGVLGARTLSHGGGVRWEKNSREYRTILDWIRGNTSTASR